MINSIKIYLGATIPISIIFFHLVSEKFLLTGIMS